MHNHRTHARPNCGRVVAVQATGQEYRSRIREQNPDESEAFVNELAYREAQSAKAVEAGA